MDALKDCLILVDNSNVWISGMQHSASKKGIVQPGPKGEIPIDPLWRVSFGNLLNTIKNGHDVIGSYLVGSRPPANDSLWEAANKHFNVEVYTRSSTGEKAVDTKLVVTGTQVICMHGKPAILKLLSGDRDFLPLVELAHQFNWETELWCFSHAMSYELAQTVTRFYPLDDVFNAIGFYVPGPTYQPM